MLIILAHAITEKELHRTNLPMPPEAPDIIVLNNVKYFVSERTFHIGDNTETYASVALAELMTEGLEYELALVSAGIGTFIYPDGKSANGETFYLVYNFQLNLTTASQ